MTGTVKTTKEPLFHVVKHAERSGRQMIGFRLLAVALSLGAGGLFLLAPAPHPPAPPAVASPAEGWARWASAWARR